VTWLILHKLSMLKAYYIPRSTNYKLKPFAIIFFETANALNDAVKLNYAYNGHNLSWIFVETKCCHKCGDLKHVAIKYSKIPNKPNNAEKPPSQNHIQQINKLYNRFKPAGHRRPLKSTRSDQQGASSYADMTKKSVKEKISKPQHQ